MSRKTSINLVINEDDNNQFTTLVNCGTEYYSDGVPATLYCKILTAVSDVVDEWNKQHKK